MALRRDACKAGWTGEVKARKRPDSPHRARTTDSVSATQRTLNMQSMPQRPQRGFMHCFTQRRMRVNGAGHIFQAGTHLNGM